LQFYALLRHDDVLSVKRYVGCISYSRIQHE